MEVNWRNELPVPYCVSKKELSLEILFLHTRAETICSFSTSEERPPPFQVRIAAYLQASSDLLSCLNYFLPHDSCSCPQLFLLACEWPIRIEEPVCSGGTCQYPVVSCGRYSKAFMCSVPGSEYEAREAHHLRRTLHSGDCGRRRSEISIASTVHAVTLTAEAKLNHWADCLYYTLPSYMSWFD